MDGKQDHTFNDQTITHPPNTELNWSESVLLNIKTFFLYINSLSKPNSNDEDKV